MKYIYKNLLFRVLAPFTMLGIAVSNCGFQGPLYLPKKSVASHPIKATSSGTKTASSSPQPMTHAGLN